MPTSLEAWENEVVNSDGHHYALYIGYVEAQGTATTVRDPDTGATTQVLPDGYSVLSEPSSRDGLGDLQVLNAAVGHSSPLHVGGMLPGYSVRDRAGV